MVISLSLGVTRALAMEATSASAKTSFFILHITSFPPARATHTEYAIRKRSGLAATIPVRIH